MRPDVAVGTPLLCRPVGQTVPGDVELLYLGVGVLYGPVTLDVTEVTGVHHLTLLGPLRGSRGRHDVRGLDLSQES